MDDKNTLLILNAIQQLKEHTDEKFNQIDTRFRQMDQHFERVDQHLTQLDQHFERVDQHLALHDNTFITIQEQLNHLTNLVTIIESEHGRKIDILFEILCSVLDYQELFKQSFHQIQKNADNHELRIQILEEKVL